MDVPSHFFKLALDPVRTEAIAFLLPNARVRTKDLAKSLKSIKDIEARSRLDFLEGIWDGSDQGIESYVQPRLWPGQKMAGVGHSTEENTMANGQAQKASQQPPLPPGPDNEKRRSTVRRYVTHAVMYAYLAGRPRRARLPALGPRPRNITPRSTRNGIVGGAMRVTDSQVWLVLLILWYTTSNRTSEPIGRVTTCSVSHMLLAQ